jgi:hypothetical protein
MGMTTTALLSIAREYGRSRDYSGMSGFDYKSLCDKLTKHLFEMDCELTEIIGQLHDQQNSALVYGQDQPYTLDFDHVISLFERLA